jgi:hypothetical protein
VDGGNCLMRILISLLLTRHCWHAQFKGDQICRVCSMHGGDQKCVQKFAQKT